MRVVRTLAKVVVNAIAIWVAALIIGPVSVGSPGDSTARSIGLHSACNALAYGFVRGPHRIRRVDRKPLTLLGYGLSALVKPLFPLADSIVTIPLPVNRATKLCSKFTLFTRLSGIDTPVRRKIPLWYATRSVVTANLVVFHWMKA